MARQRITGAFTGTGMGAALAVSHGNFENPPGLTATIWGTFSGTIVLQRSQDNGNTWVTISQSAAGTPVSYTASCDLNISDPVVGDMYAWNCTVYTSGTINWSLAQ
jgi:hypothetical protein